MFNRIFRAEGKCPEKPLFKSLQRYRAARVAQYSGSNGISLANGEEWSSNRTKAQKSMLKKENSYVVQLGSISDEFIERSNFSNP